MNVHFVCQAKAKHSGDATVLHPTHRHASDIQHLQLQFALAQSCAACLQAGTSAGRRRQSGDGSDAGRGALAAAGSVRGPAESSKTSN